MKIAEAVDPLQATGTAQHYTLRILRMLSALQCCRNTKPEDGVIEIVLTPPSRNRAGMVTHILEVRGKKRKGRPFFLSK